LTAYLPHKPWQLVLMAAFGLFVAGVMFTALVALILTPTLPSIESLNDSNLKVPMRVYTAEGLLIAEFGEEKRIPIKIDEVPEQLVHAILAAEDDSFYYHQGVDFQGILRATVNNFRSGGRSEGASTITMQVARNYFLSPEKTYTRKLKEILLAFKIERELGKDEILELYLNKIFLGNRAYGFAAAAQVYYGKNLLELTLPEMAMLAGLPKAPSRNNPLANPESALERRAYVLRRMLKLRYIDAAAYAEAVNAPLAASRHVVRFTVEAPYIAEMARQYMYQAYAENSYAGGYHVYTTIRAREQQAADAALRKGLMNYDRRHGYRGPAGHEKIGAKTLPTRLDELLKEYPTVGPLIPGIVTEIGEKSAKAYTQDGTVTEIAWPGLAWAFRYIDENTVGPSPKTAAEVLRPGDIIYLEPVKEGEWWLAQVPKIAGALVSLNPKDGSILALTSGFDFYQSKFNRALQAERQPGSGLKPFVYSAALEKGFTPASLISGAPIVVEDVSLEDEWKPEDYSKRFYGPTRLRKALTLSLNLVSVRLLRAIEPGYAVDYLARFGFNRNTLPRNLSLVLGTASITPLQMASSFSVFANGGYRVEPYFISRIEDADHKVLEVANPAMACANYAIKDTKSAKEESGGCPDLTQDTAPPQPAPAPPPPDAENNAAQDGAPQPPAPRFAPRVITPQNAFLMTSILRDVVSYGTGQGATVLGRRDLAGKTGTTNDHRDAWFNGFNADLVTTAWVGFDQPAPLGRGEVGGHAALPIWVDYMRTALEGMAEKPLAPPPGIVSAIINRETGKLTDATDPDSMPEYFVDGTQPTDAGTASGPTTGGGGENVREGLF
jgi:penicillin-binding protein 1A